MAYDVVRGLAHGLEPMRFCKLYQLATSGSFAYSHYGERVAECLANFWCMRHQALYNMYIEAGRENFEFTSDVMARAPASSDELDEALADMPGMHRGFARRGQVVAILPRRR